MGMKAEHEDREQQEIPEAELPVENGNGDPAEQEEAAQLPPIELEDLDPVELVALVIELKSVLGEIETKNEEYLDGWQRSRAEFANYKKRILKEQSLIHQVARGEVIKLYLDIADDLKLALESKPEGGEGGSWAGGIELIYQKLINRLEAEGVKPMDALGQEFDPNIHEALMKEEHEDYESGQIIEVMQEGYWLGEKVLRPALVRVAA